MNQHSSCSVPASTYLQTDNVESAGWLMNRAKTKYRKSAQTKKRGK